MANSEQSEDDWTLRHHPWTGNGARSLTETEVDEIRLFQKQDRFVAEDEARRVAFERKIQAQRDDFERKEIAHRNNRVLSFTHHVWHYQIDGARERAVPAYTFTWFRKLPIELQLRIWSLAARTTDPELRLFTTMSQDSVESSYSPYRSSPVLGSSRIYHQRPIYNHRKSELIALRICHDSRQVALGIYANLSCTTNRWISGYRTYMNTLYDTFYIGGAPWTDFKVLIDLLIRQNTTRSMRPAVASDLEKLENIRLLIVDLNIFGAVPVQLWAGFPKLEELTICFYPYNTISEQELGNPRTEEEDKPRFANPQRGTMYGKRANWIFKTATKTLHVVQQDFPKWKLPKVKVAVRFTGRERDIDIEEQCDGVDGWADEDEIPAKEDECEDASKNPEDTDGAGEVDAEIEGKEVQKIGQDPIVESDEDERDKEELDENSGDDSIWYEQAAARIIHHVPMAQIKQLKHEYHPGRVAGILDEYDAEIVAERTGRKPKWKDYMDYYTDSEGEEGKEAYKRYGNAWSTEW